MKFCGNVEDEEREAEGAVGKYWIEWGVKKPEVISRVNVDEIIVHLGIFFFGLMLPGASFCVYTNFLE